MNILQITLKPIFPIIDGGCMAMYRMLYDLYNAGCKIKNLTISTNKHPFSYEHFPKNIGEQIKPEHIFVNTDINYFSAIASTFSSKSYNISRFDNKKFHKKITETLKNEQFDAVILESVYMLPYIQTIRSNSSAKIILRTHNVEYQLWEQQAQTASNFITKKIQNKFAENLKKFELEHINKVDGIAAISKKIIETYKINGAKKPMIHLPLSMEINHNEIDYENQEFHFLGAMNWHPNIEAVDWLLNEIFNSEKHEWKLNIAGSYMKDELLNLKKDNIHIHGKVDNVMDFVSKHGTMLIPIKQGSGVRIKVLEAMSMGIPIIATKLGIEGIGNIQNGTHYLEANTTEEFISQMNKLNTNPLLKKEIGNAAKKFVNENFSTNYTSKKILEFIKNI